MVHSSYAPLHSIQTQQDHRGGYCYWEAHISNQSQLIIPLPENGHNDTNSDTGWQGLKRTTGLKPLSCRWEESKAKGTQPDIVSVTEIQACYVGTNVQFYNENNRKKRFSTQKCTLKHFLPCNRSLC